MRMMEDTHPSTDFSRCQTVIDSCYSQPVWRRPLPWGSQLARSFNRSFDQFIACHRSPRRTAHTCWLFFSPVKKKSTCLYLVSLLLILEALFVWRCKEKALTVWI